MTILKNKAMLRIAVFITLLTIVFWLMPAGFISAEGSDNLAELQAAADSANAALAEAQAAADAASGALAGAQAAVDTAIANLAAAESGGNPDEITAAQDAVAVAQAAFTDAQAAADAANAALADAQAAADAANAALEAVLNPGSGDDGTIEDPPEVPLEDPLPYSPIDPVTVVLSPVITTDKADYSPEETVIMTGANFTPVTIYTIEVVRPDGSIVIGDGTFTPGSDTILADASGNFTYNYILDGIMGVYTVRAIDAGGAIVATTTFTDCNAKIELHKFWDKNNNGVKDGSDSWLSGADFQLYKKSGSSWGSPIATETSDSNGYVHFHITSYGTYKVVESNPPSGYTGTFSSGDIVITSSNDESTINLGNVANTAQTGTFTLTKNFTGGSPYPDAYFYLKDGSGNYYKTNGAIDTKANAKVTINTNGGTALWSNLPQQTYYLEEDAVSGYTTDNNPGSGITVDSGHLSKTRTVTNTKIVGSVYIEKHGLEGVEYSWADEVKFILDGPGGLHLEAIVDNTDHTGISDNVTWSNLPVGSYTLTQSYSGLGNKYTYTSDLASPYNFTIDAGHKNFSFEIHNCAQKGSVKFTKTGLGAGIAAKFKLFFVGADGVPGGSDDVQFDGEQQLTGPGSPHIHWSNVPFGTYYITESVVPGGYVKMADITGIVIDVIGEEECRTGNNVLANGSIVVTKSGMMGSDLVKISLLKGATLIEEKLNVGNQTVTFSNLAFGNDYSITESYKLGNAYTYGAAVQNPVNPINVASSTPVSVTLVNDPQKGSINVHKTGLEDGDTAIFSLTGPGGPYANITVANGETKGWTDLPYGSYTVIESWSSGNVWTYNTDLSSSPVLIGESSENPIIEVVNTAIKGSIEIFKTDQVTGLPLGGSTFQLWHFSTPTLVSEVVLGADGHYKWENLPYGQYQVVEAIAPAGYLVRDPVDVTIDPKGTLNVVLQSEIADPRMPGFITLTKTDSVTGLPVAGAEYWVYNSGGTHVETLITGPDGSVTVSGFVWGTYSVKEISAPAGYLVDPASYPLTIGATSTRVSISVTDTPAGGGTTTITVAGLTEGGIQVLAFTGIDPIIPIAGGSALMAGIAMLIASLIRRGWQNNHLKIKMKKYPKVKNY